MQSADTPRLSGTVKFFHPERGFGFITPDQGGPDVFIHMNQLRQSQLPMLNTGDRVSFEIDPHHGKGGRSAAHRVRLESQPAPSFLPAFLTRPKWEGQQ